MLRRAASHHLLKEEQELHNKQSPNKLAAPDRRRCVFVVIYRVSPARLSDRICLRHALLVRTSHPLDSPNTRANVRCSSCWGQLLFESAWTVWGDGVFDLCLNRFYKLPPGPVSSVSAALLSSVRCWQLFFHTSALLPAERCGNRPPICRKDSNFSKAGSIGRAWKHLAVIDGRGY